MAFSKVLNFPPNLCHKYLSLTTKADLNPAKNLTVAQRWHHLKWRHMMSGHITIHDIIYLLIDKTKWNWTAQIPRMPSNSLSVFTWRSFSQISPSRKMFSRESERLLHFFLYRIVFFYRLPIHLQYEENAVADLIIFVVFQLIELWWPGLFLDFKPNMFFHRIRLTRLSDFFIRFFLYASFDSNFKPTTKYCSFNINQTKRTLEQSNYIIMTLTQSLNTCYMASLLCLKKLAER